MHCILTPLRKAFPSRFSALEQEDDDGLPELDSDSPDMSARFLFRVLFDWLVCFAPFLPLAMENRGASNPSDRKGRLESKKGDDHGRA